MSRTRTRDDGKDKHVDGGTGGVAADHGGWLISVLVLLAFTI